MSRSRLVIDPGSIREYMDRDWERARRNKQAFWKARSAHVGLHGILKIADDLRRWMIARVPEWPTQGEREEDLETHRRVSQALSVTTRATVPHDVRPRGRTRRVR